MKKIYVAGPMRGKPHLNYHAFDAARDRLAGDFDDVFSPADQDRRLLNLPPDWFPPVDGGVPGDLDIRQLMHLDLSWIALEATHIYMLRGWELSTGAKAEHALALAIGIDIIYEASE